MPTVNSKPAETPVAAQAPVHTEAPVATEAPAAAGVNWEHPGIAAFVDVAITLYDLGAVDAAAVQLMTCNDMRELLEERGLRKSGNKLALRARLLEVPADTGEVKRRLNRAVRWHLQHSIHWYGEDGYGDKPADMDVIEYWLAHIDPTTMKATVRAMWSNGMH